MPQYKVHKRIGYLASIIVTVTLLIFLWKEIEFTYSMLWAIPVTWFYANLPDLDHHLSKLRKMTLTVIFISMGLITLVAALIDVWAALIGIMLLGILGLTLLQVKHRGATHTYLFVTIAALPMLFIHWFVFIIAVTASFSHIFVDRFWSKWKRRIKKFMGISGETYEINIKI